MKKTLTFCDMCGQLMTDDPERNRNAGTFYRESWDGEFFELCGPCADKVQKFIHEKEKNNDREED